jgi:hypothetical protein
LTIGQVNLTETKKIVFHFPMSNNFDDSSLSSSQEEEIIRNSVIIDFRISSVLPSPVINYVESYFCQVFKKNKWIKFHKNLTVKTATKLLLNFLVAYEPEKNVGKIIFFLS